MTEERKVYPLSVIRGGAYSAEELNRARRLDPVVRAHYANFGSHPVVQQTTKDLLVYVSYRKSDAVYWTRKRRRIPQGESVLSDGNNLARARCGNRLSFTPQQPVGREQEPAEEALNTPETPEISIPFNAPLSPGVQADLYTSADSLPAVLLSRLPLPAPFPPSQTGGAYAPMPGWGTGSPMGGGIPFLAGGSGTPARTNTSPGATVNIPAAGGGLAIVSTPEPETAKLLFVSFLVLILLCLRGKVHSGL